MPTPSSLQVQKKLELAFSLPFPDHVNYLLDPILALLGKRGHVSLITQQAEITPEV